MAKNAIDLASVLFSVSSSSYILDKNMDVLSNSMKNFLI